MTDLADIASELYSQPLDEFTAARNERAKSLDDKSLAKEVRALRKPSASAWLLNMMTVHRGDQLREALKLGAAMREAQQQLDRSELKKLGIQRQQLISALVEDGVSLSGDLGHPASSAAALEVEQTLRAALADAGAAAAVSSGRLIRPLEASGWDAVDLAGAVGGPFDAGGSGADSAGDSDDGDGEDTEPETDPTAEARAELEEAEDRSEEAVAALTRARERVNQLDSHREALVSQVRELRKRIRALEQDIDAIDDDADDAVRERTEAERSTKEAAREVERARRTVEKLTG